MRIDEILNMKFFNSQHRALMNLRHTANLVNNHYNNLYNSFNITVSQVNILRILQETKEKINVNTLKERMAEKSPNTTRLMDKLHAKKLISRTYNEDDRRMIYVEITQQGERLLQELDAKYDFNLLLPNGLSETEANTLSELLDKLRADYDGARS